MMADNTNIIIMDTKPDIAQIGNNIIKKEIVETVVFIPVDHELDNNNVQIGNELKVIKQEIKVEIQDCSSEDELNAEKMDTNIFQHNKSIDLECIKDENSNQSKIYLENKTIDNDTSSLKDTHIIKEEFIDSPKTNTNHNQLLKKKLENNFKNAMVIIKNELIDPEIHEDNVDLENKPAGSTQDLYRDHIIKEELAIGPDIVQKVENKCVPKHLHKTRRGYIQKTECRKHIYMCEYCQMNFYSGKDIRKHVKEHVSQEKAVMATQSHINSNLNQSHSKCSENKLTVHSDNLKGNKYSCVWCKKEYATRSSLHHHVNSCLSAKHKCKVCGKCFSIPGNLYRHMNIHTGKKPHTCDYCNSKFGRKDYLAFHIQNHHSGKLPKAKDIICDLCNTGLSSKCMLTYHKKYTCPMNREKTKPIRNKTYTCDVCLRSYPYRTSLQAHIMRRHTNTVLPTHECDICGQKYLKKHNLKCHMLSKHMNKMPYRCSKCNESFTWQSTLRSHEIKVHGRTTSKKIKTERL